MTSPRYYSPQGGHSDQSQLLTDRAVFTDAYAVIPKGVMQDIVTSTLPHWTKTRVWILARPLSGFAETFSQYIVEVSPGGGSKHPEPDPQAQGAIFVTRGTIALTIQGVRHDMSEGGFAYLPPGCDWELACTGDGPATFHWIRKKYQAVQGLSAPEAFVTSDQEVTPDPMKGMGNKWCTTRFMDVTDLRFDMHITIVTLEAGVSIPFAETHVMEHGLYMLEGKGVYRLNQDWVEVEAGDFLWLRAFCPQACYAGGPGPFRYLLYKDMNRHAVL